MEELLAWDDCNEITEEDILDENELNRIARNAEKPELTDPVFLYVKGRSR